jgi:monoamine oxidase
MHPTTVIRHAKAASLAAGKPIVAVSGKPNKLLTPDIKQKRLQFCEQMTWSNIMFTDRKKFYLRYPGTRVKKYQWVVKGEQRVAFAPNTTNDAGAGNHVANAISSTG